MADPIVWPRCLMPRECAVNMVPRTLGGGASLNGFMQAVASPAGLWHISYSGIPLNTPERIRAWRAIAGQAEGRANALVVPTYDRPLLTPSLGVHRVPHSDGATLSDGSEYLGLGAEYVASNAYSAGATSMYVSKISGAALDAGMQFSIGHRLYRITYLTSQTSIKFWPMLREDVAQGAQIEFVQPVCKVRLLSDEAMNLSLLISRLGTGEVSFIEDPN